MQPCKNHITLAFTLLAAAALSNTVHAKIEPLAVNYKTVPNITILEKTKMNFGAGMSLANAASCTMVISDSLTATSFPGDNLLLMAGTSADAPGTTSGDLTGGGCAASAGSKGTFGLYEISGIEGGTVKVKVNPITAGTSFNYIPAGCVANYQGAGDGDTCVAVSSGAFINAVIASSGDTVGNTNGGIPNPGKTLIALGGVITTTRIHTAGEDMEDEFTIEVTY